MRICASLPTTARGLAVVEVPSLEDALDVDRPAGVELRWLVREHGAKPGSLALAALRDLPAGAVAADVHAFIVGEQALPTEARRHLVNERGLAKDRISFTGYWRVGAASPTPKSQVSAA